MFYPVVVHMVEYTSVSEKYRERMLGELNYIIQWLTFMGKMSMEL